MRNRWLQSHIFILTLMLFAPFGAALAQTASIPAGNYQATGTRDFPNNISVPGLPTMFTHWNPKAAKDIKDLTEIGLSSAKYYCQTRNSHSGNYSQEAANNMIGGLQKYRAASDQAYQQATSSSDQGNAAIDLQDAQTIATLINTIKLAMNCPPPVEHASAFTGPQIGMYAVRSLSSVTTIEKLAATGVATNRFNDCCSGVGGGLDGAMMWPGLGNFVWGGAVAAYFPDDKVTTQFAGGNYLQSTMEFSATAQARAGYAVEPYLLLYAQAGVAVGIQSLTVNFGPVASHDATTVGPTVGFGAEWLLSERPSSLLGGMPTVFLEFNHIWWNDANFTRPASSPLFNYTWQRESNVLKAGIRIHF